MYKRIMVAVDDAFATDNVLRAAIALATQSGARLAVCHALDGAIFCSPAGRSVVARYDWSGGAEPF